MGFCVGVTLFVSIIVVRNLLLIRKAKKMANKLFEDAKKSVAKKLKKEEETKVEGVKSDVMVLIFDKEKLKVIKALLILASHSDVFMESLKETNRQNIFIEFIEELSVKTHKLGWCDDPKCEYEKKAKK